MKITRLVLFNIFSNTSKYHGYSDQMDNYHIIMKVLNSINNFQEKMVFPFLKEKVALKYIVYTMLNFEREKNCSENALSNICIMYLLSSTTSFILIHLLKDLEQLVQKT